MYKQKYYCVDACKFYSCSPTPLGHESKFKFVCFRLEINNYLGDFYCEHIILSARYNCTILFICFDTDVLLKGKEMVLKIEY